VWIHMAIFPHVRRSPPLGWARPVELWGPGIDATACRAGHQQAECCCTNIQPHGWPSPVARRRSALSQRSPS
jgi:hypothetical protein